MARIGWIVYACLLIRVLLESAAADWYPERVTDTDAGEIEPVSRAQELGSLAVRVGVFLAVVVAFFPMVWQLWFSLGVFAFGVLACWEWVCGRLPNSSAIYRYMPVGLLSTVIMILVGQVAAHLLAKWQPDAERQVLDGLVYLALPGLLVGVLSMIGRDGERPPLRWWHRIAAVPLVGVLLHFNMTSF